MVRKGCNSLVRAEKILTHIAWVGMASYMELLNKFQYPKSSLLNLLNVMVDCGFLIKNKNGYYSLGIKNYELGCQALHRQNIFEVTKRPMQELSLKSGLVCHLGAMESISAIYLDKIESPYQVRMHSRIGGRASIFRLSAGKALLARFSAEELKELHEPVPPEVVREFSDILTRGYAVDDEQNEQGLRCVGAAIIDSRGRPRGAVSVSAPVYRFPPELVERYGKLVSEVAEAVTREIGSFEKCVCSS